MTNYPFIRHFQFSSSCSSSSPFSFVALEDQPIKFLHSTEVQDLLASERLYQDAQLEGLKEEKSESDLTSGRSAKIGRDGKKIAASVPVPPSYAMGQSAPTYAPVYDEDGGMIVSGGGGENGVGREGGVASGSGEGGWKADTCHHLEGEAAVLLTWVNRFICKRQFCVDRFPDCLSDSHGDVFVDFIEQVRLCCVISC